MSEYRKENRQIKFRVSEDEYGKLEQSANSLQLSVAAFAKKRIMGYRIKPPKIDKAGAMEIAKQLRAIGTNVNQMAKETNMDVQLFKGADEQLAELQKIKEELQAIWQQLN